MFGFSRFFQAEISPQKISNGASGSLELPRRFGSSFYIPGRGIKIKEKYFWQTRIGLQACECTLSKIMTLVFVNYLILIFQNAPVEKLAIST